MKSAKGLQGWKDVCILACLPPQILKLLMKTWFALHVILFQEMFQYQDAISICYGRQATINLFSQMPTNQM
jgi:hypothetical protein